MKTKYDPRELPKGTEVNLNEPTPYARALRADRVAAQEADEMKSFSDDAQANRPQHWVRGYHAGDVCDRATMRVVAMFPNDADVGPAIIAHNQHAALVQALKHLKEQSLRFDWEEGSAFGIAFENAEKLLDAVRSGKAIREVSICREAEAVGIEFGFRCAEKGMNLEATMVRAAELRGEGKAVAA